MPSTPIPIFWDTSAIREAGFHDPDCQKLLKYSISNDVRLFISHIAWQELRTQFLQSAWSEVLKLRRQFDAVQRRQPSSLILQGLRAPVIDLWDEPEIQARSHAAMDEFARDNRITIVPLCADHADRAWHRYFEASPPFNPEVTDREKRRKDIPDSWILEAAIDVKRDHSSLIAVCHDGNLAVALKKVLDIRVFRTVAEVVEHLDGAVQSVKTIKSVKTRDSAYVPPTEGPVQADGALAAVFTEAESQFRNVATKVIGLISYLGSPTKEQIYALLERSGIPLAIAKNVAEQLALATIIQDTGHHYIPGNKEAGAQATAAVEPEIIRLVTGED
ncbi:MAG: DUF4935 domain-containing protein [Bryobacteraceae bacterium]|nr:DUF4935 domain-containing protein [Bryobacteraceae bacterium]